MVSYHCTKCDIKCEQSTCPVCNERTEMTSSIYWCHECNIPTVDEVCPICHSTGKYIATDIRPVFPEERLLIECLWEKPLEYRNSSVWFGSGRYIIDGRTARLSSQTYLLCDPDALRNELQHYDEENKENSFLLYVEKWVQANKVRYDYITTEAMQAIQEVAKDTPVSHMFVSFSGGKDSTVTSSLVMRALGTPSIIHLYGDTTLEFPESKRYVDRFKSTNRKTPVLIAKNTDKNFYEMCEIVGPPSRVKRWCCTIFKTGAITKKIEKTFPGVKRLLSFQGIRRNESNSRNKYDRKSSNSKISKQVMFSPVIDWLDSDIWLYILTSGIDFNDAYRLGYTRVGCWCCPNNSKWSEFLSAVYMPEQHKEWRDQLIRFAKAVGKPDPEEYVDQGGWKARQGGNGLEVSKRFAVGFTPCATDENSFNYALSRPITDDFFDLFKPFGNINYDMGNKRKGEVYVVDNDNTPILKLQGKVGRNELRVSILRLPIAGCKRIFDAELKVKCQISKFQICLGCMACTSVCKHDAIHIEQSEFGYYSYTINEKRCIHCGQCISHFDGGCYMRDVIRTKG